MFDPSHQPMTNVHAPMLMLGERPEITRPAVEPSEDRRNPIPAPNLDSAYSYPVGTSAFAKILWVVPRVSGLTQAATVRPVADDMPRMFPPFSPWDEAATSWTASPNGALTVPGEFSGANW